MLDLKGDGKLTTVIESLVAERWTFKENLCWAICIVCVRFLEKLGKVFCWPLNLKVIYVEIKMNYEWNNFLCFKTSSIQ